jgi:hypothetical protein
MKVGPGGRGTRVTRLDFERKLLERSAVEGESPVCEEVWLPVGIPSKTEHVKPRLNPERPLSKAKYSSVTDSEPVP